MLHLRQLQRRRTCAASWRFFSRVSCSPGGAAPWKTVGEGGPLHRLLSVQCTSGSPTQPSAQLQCSVFRKCVQWGWVQGRTRCWGPGSVIPVRQRRLCRVEMPHNRARNDTEDLGKVRMNLRRLAFRTPPSGLSQWVSVGCRVAHPFSAVEGACVILREALVSLCQVNLFNIAAKYNKSHIPNVPEGIAAIITVAGLL